MMSLNSPNTRSQAITKTTLIKQNKKEPTEKANKRTVRFNNRVKCSFIERIPKKKHKYIWYKAEDADETCRRDDGLREIISSNEALYAKNIEILNAQGIHTNDQVRKGRMIIKGSINAVLDEQDRQEAALFGPNMSGELTLDVDKIAEAYRLYSQESLKEAQTIATRLQEHMQEISSCKSSGSSSISPNRSMKGRISARRSSRSIAPIVQKLTRKS